MVMGGLRADVGIEGRKKGHTKQSALSAELIYKGLNTTGHPF